jgi:hypothetical protein
MHILFEEENGASLDEILTLDSEGDGWYCVPSAIGDVIRTLREEIRAHVGNAAAARQMEHRLLLLESLTAAQSRGRAFWSGGADS